MKALASGGCGGFERSNFEFGGESHEFSMNLVVKTETEIGGH